MTIKFNLDLIVFNTDYATASDVIQTAVNLLRKHGGCYHEHINIRQNSYQQFSHDRVLNRSLVMPHACLEQADLISSFFIITQAKPVICVHQNIDPIVVVIGMTIKLSQKHIERASLIIFLIKANLVPIAQPITTPVRLFKIINPFITQ